MTAAQQEAVAKLREQFLAISWSVTVAEINGKVCVEAYGGPRAFRAVWVEPDGTATTSIMA